MLPLLIVQATLALPPLDQFDGARVGDIIFGQTADKDLKKMFKVGKGAMRPEALVVSSDERWRADALLAGRGADAKAIGVWFESKRASVLEDLVKDLADAEKLYAVDRSSDWFVQAYPARGIALFAVREGNREFVEGVLLTDKDRLIQLSRSLKSEETRMLDLQRIFERKDRTVYLRSFDLSVTRKNIDIGDVRREERLLSDLAERRAESRNIVFDRRGEGRVLITVAIDFEKTNVSASLSGSNEVGAISGSGSASAEKFKVANDVAYYDRRAVEDAVLEALRDALNSAERAIRDQRPPTEQDDRKRMMYGVINAAVR